jgi:hypothetical protein
MLSHVWWEVGQHLLLVGGVRDVSSLTCTTWTCTVSYLQEYKLQTDCILSLNAKDCSSKKLCTWQWLFVGIFLFTKSGHHLP